MNQQQTTAPIQLISQRNDVRRQDNASNESLKKSDSERASLLLARLTTLFPSLKAQDEYIWQKEWLPLVSTLTNQQIDVAVATAKFKGKVFAPTAGEFLRMAHGLLDDESAYFYAKKNPDYYEYIHRAAYESGMLDKYYRPSAAQEKKEFMVAYERICAMAISGVKFEKPVKIADGRADDPYNPSNCISFDEFKQQNGIPADWNMIKLGQETRKAGSFTALCRNLHKNHPENHQPT
jgi:hypothetical protein